MFRGFRQYEPAIFSLWSVGSGMAAIELWIEVECELQCFLVVVSSGLDRLGEPAESMRIEGCSCLMVDLLRLFCESRIWLAARRRNAES
jgi:hypothetical protein